MEVFGFTKRQYRAVKDLLVPEDWYHSFDKIVVNKILNITNHCHNRFSDGKFIAVIVYYQDAVTKEKWFRLIHKNLESGGSGNASFLLRDSSRMSRHDVRGIDYYADIEWSLGFEALCSLISKNSV